MVPTTRKAKRLRQRAGRRHLYDKRARELLEQAGVGEDDELLTTPEVAEWLGVSSQFLNTGRSKGRYGPKFVQLGPRCIRYRVDDVREYLRERARLSTADYGEADRHGHHAYREKQPRKKPAEAEA